MATFILICRDKPGGLPLRMATRETHLAWIAANRDGVTRAGPVLGDDGGPVGSVLFLDAESRADAEALAAADPYAKAGLFESAELLSWRQTVGAP
jgi:uncharacterized protein YciI